MSRWYSYEDDEYVVFVERDVYIKEKTTNDFYKIGIEALPANLQNKLSEYKPKISGRIFLLWCVLLAVNIVLNMFLSLNLNLEHGLEYTMNELVPFICILVFYIGSHEFAHIAALRYFGKWHTKVGLKLNYYVFPAVYVEMNEVSLLARREKFVVHSAGLMINYVSLNVLYFIFVLFGQHFLLLVFRLLSMMTLLNLIPMLNSDGYKMLMVCLNTDELENIIKNNKIIIVIQIIGIMTALYSAIDIIIWIYQVVKGS